MMRVAAEICRVLLLAVVTPAALAGSADGPVVDLGYAKYQGTYNSTFDLNIFKG